MNNTSHYFLSASVALACACSGFSQEYVNAPQFLDGASIRIHTASGTKIFCEAKDITVILYKPRGNQAQLIFTHASKAGILSPKIRYEKLSGDKAYDEKENKGLPALLTFNSVKGSVYHVSVEGFWSCDYSHKVEQVQSMEIIFPTNIHGDDCMEILSGTKKSEYPR